FQPNDPVNFPSTTYFGSAVAAVQPLFPLLSGTGFSGYNNRGSVIEVQNPNPTAATVVVSFSGYATNGQNYAYSPLSIPPGSWAIFDGDDTGFFVNSDLPVRVISMGVFCGIDLLVCPSPASPYHPAATGVQGPMLVPSTLGFAWQVGSS